MNTLELTSPLVSVDWLAAHLDHKDLIILDATIKKVTSDITERYPEVKIKNSRFFDIKKMFSDTTSDIPNMLLSPEKFADACQQLGISSHHKIVVYDKIGMYSSPRVWWMFKIMGHSQIAVLNGGLPAWQEKDLPCEPEDALQKEYALGNFEAHFNPKLVTAASEVLEEMNNEQTVILDARSSGRFNATEPEPRASLKGGHIPNSKSLPYKQLLEKGIMKSTPELEKIFSDFNIDNKKLIFTCGSGITACILMMAAEIAGYSNLSVYDGSWSEWGQLDGVPISV
ncbi:sulfurtransferase [Aquimarina spongiae]|uniref:Thiosulfate/3-mercaptopyruvate sulfurtransferase n=1 Tax=Aquimarina spongiae TaxID=570521 RepID=A0A1M6F704_9FLAO|nr:sulfurtransferase [Aquimarina spongiae]SHI93369.1 thiosulfate/3-mercaptopyruvate sulfurtransferase [Aquimarina spongiae]